MTRQQNTRLDTFLSLGWYEVALRFLFTFVAKTSEVLLAAGLVVSTANFLTDGSILAAHPGVSIAWAWAQALAIDSSLGVSLSYAFQCLKQEEWIRGVLYALLTLLLAVVAGAITTIDIVSHALHLSTGDAMMQMGINIAVLSRLRAIAVIGFILMGRLRDLPLAALLTKTEPVPQPSLAPASAQSQETRIQAMIQSLCSQCSTEEMAQILNACIAAKKIVLAQVPPKSIPEPQQPRVDQQRQSHQPEIAFDPVGTRAAPGEPAPPAAPPLQSEPESVSVMEPSRKAPVAKESPITLEHPLWKDPGPSSQGLYVPEPIASVPSKEPVPAPVQEPQDGAVTQSEPEAAPSQERLEQAYQSLLAEGKKPSGRALAERVHVHRSTCVEWLRMKQQQVPENEQLLEEPERDGTSMLDGPSSTTLMDVPGKVPERKITSEPAEPSETALIDLPEREMDRHEVASNVSPDVFPDFSLPEDTPDAWEQSHPAAI
jgi:hypothetical protein